MELKRTLIDVSIHTIIITNENLLHVTTKVVKRVELLDVTPVNVTLCNSVNKSFNTVFKILSHSSRVEIPNNVGVKR